MKRITAITHFNHAPFRRLWALMLLCGALSLFADDLVNPCTFVSETMDCDPSGGGSPAEIEIKSIKLNGKRKDSRVVNINQDLQISARLKYKKRAKAKITTTFTGCPPREVFKRIKPEPAITWQVTVNGTPTGGGTYNQVYTGVGLEPLVPAPPNEGTYSLTAEFLADAPGDNCFTGLPFSIVKIFSLQVFDGPALIDITAVISHDGTLKRAPTPIASGSYLCRGQGVSIDLTANFALPLAQYGLQASDVSWTVNKPGAGDLSGGAGASGETVTWTQAAGYVSTGPDDLVFTATAPGMDPMGFKLTIFSVDSVSAIMEVDETKTITIPDHMIQPTGLDKTKGRGALTAGPTDEGDNTATVWLWTREYIASLNDTPGQPWLPAEAVQTSLDPARIIKSATFQLTGSDLELVVVSGSTPGEVNLTWESEKPPEPAVDPSPGIDNPARLFHRQHINVLPATVDVEVDTVHITGTPTDVGPKYLCKDNGAPVNLTAKPVSGTFTGTPLPQWTVTTTAGAFPASQPSPSNGVADISLTLDQPGSYDIKAEGSNGTEATYTVNVLEVDLDIDSDNNSGYGVNESLAEDAIEDVAGDALKPGKVIGVNDGDVDHDGVPGFADGFDRNSTASWVKDDVSSGQKFAQLVLKLPEPIDPSVAEIQFTYDAADPFFISQPHAGNSYTWGIPTTGNLRVWIKDADQARDSQMLGSGGDYIHSATPESATDLGFSAATRRVVFYLEGVRPSVTPGDLSIQVDIDPDGPGPEGFICGDTVRVTVADVTILDASQTDTDHVQVALWDDGFKSNGNIYNSDTPAENFIDRDSEKFFIQVNDPSANKNSGSVESVTVEVGSVDGNNAVDDNLTEITLTETGANTGVFLSTSQLLMSPDLPAGDNPDDDFKADDGASNNPEDDQLNDRTHRASILGAVDAVYNETTGESCFVCDRNDNGVDERKRLKVQFHILNEPYEDTGFKNSSGVTSGSGNGVFDYEDSNNNGKHDHGERSERFLDVSNLNSLFWRGNQASSGSRGGVVSEELVQVQLERAKIAWAQACIEVVQVGGITYHDAPTDGSGDDILSDGTFHVLSDANELQTDHFTMIASDLNILHVFFVAKLTGVTGVNVWGVAYIPSQQLQDITFVCLGPDQDPGHRILAHEIGHSLTNVDDTDIPDRYFFPQHPIIVKDYNVKHHRRISPATAAGARTPRAFGNHLDPGNLILIDY